MRKPIGLGGVKSQWKVQNEKGAKYLGELEFQDKEGEYHYFQVLETKTKILFGGSTNSGFIQSGYISKDGRSTNETLQNLLQDLETYYNDGPKYVSDIVVNKRM